MREVDELALDLLAAIEDSEVGFGHYINPRARDVTQHDDLTEVELDILVSMSCVAEKLMQQGWRKAPSA